MRIELAGWSSIGLRCPDVEIDLRHGGKPATIALMQMPNGTGKTTTRELLHAALSGAAATWDPDKVRHYRRRDEAHDFGRFTVTLLVDGDVVTWELTLDFEGGKARYKTSRPKSGGVVAGYVRPPGLQDVLKSDFLDLFIFDGELAEHLLDPRQAKADDAVDALCQIHLLRDAAAITQEFWERETKQQTSKTETGLSKHEEQQRQLLKRKAAIEKAREAASARIPTLEQRAIELAQLIDRRLSETATTRERYQKAREDLARAEGEVNTKSESLMTALRMPHALHPALGDRLVRLRDNLDVLKLPEKASAQFFEELMREKLCLCDREMDEAAKTSIRRRAADVLDTDESAVVNEIKREVSRFIDTTEPDSGHDRVQRLSRELSLAVRDQRTAEQEVRALQQLLTDGGDDQLKGWQDEQADVGEKLKELKETVAEIDGPGDIDADISDIRSLSLLAKRLNEVEEKIAVITKTVELREDTALMRKILADAERRARDQIKAELVTTCNDRLDVILKNDPLRIERIDRALRLQGQEGGSVGQTLAVGYTFLISALQRGANDFPLIVDSPANSIDLGVRRRIAQAIPQLCSQFVAFTINVERAGFVDTLEASGVAIDFLTLFRKTAGTQGLMRSLPTAGVTQSENAVLVADRDYFYAFDVRDEEEVPA